MLAAARSGWRAFHQAPHAAGCDPRTPDHLTAITGIWHRGEEVNSAGRRRVRPVHPFRKSIAELEIGDQFVSDFREVRLEDIIAFADSLVISSMLTRMQRLQRTRFPSQVAHGTCWRFLERWIVRGTAPGPVLANISLENLKFFDPRFLLVIPSRWC